MMINPERLHSELSFQTARSGGSGGQNVNKVETKVELRFDIPKSEILNVEEKQLLLDKLGNKLTNESVLVLYHQTERSQLANKEKVIEKFDKLIRQASVVLKKRKPTKPTMSSKLERREAKSHKSALKFLRRKPMTD